MKKKQIYLNIGAFLDKSFVNGPGARAVIWLQGCKKRCPGCINPQFLDEIPRKIMSVDELAMKVFKIPDIEGVTYSGGEPFLQAEGLCKLSKILKERGKSIVCYTGYTYEEIKNSANPYWHKLLNYLDILIDGEFKKEKKMPLLWRGSSNQKVYFLSEKYKKYSLMINEYYQNFEFHIVDGSIILTGFIDEKLEEILLQKLKENEKMDFIADHVGI